MALTALKVAVLLCFLIMPLKGPSKRRKISYSRPDKTILSSSYGVNEYGDLEELVDSKKEL
jgi:hypothetical protein